MVMDGFSVVMDGPHVLSSHYEYLSFHNFVFCLRDGFFSPKRSLLKAQLYRAGTAFYYLF